MDFARERGKWGVWRVEKRQGPTLLAELLSSLGGDLAQRRDGRSTVLAGSLPAAAEMPTHRAFPIGIGHAPLLFETDYGVFSPSEVDGGIRLLVDVALRIDAAGTLADIGTGYGPLAVGLISSGLATRAVAADVDRVALWRAQRNAARNGGDLEVSCVADLTDVPSTPPAVCNIPTRIDAERTRRPVDAAGARPAGVSAVGHPREPGGALRPLPHRSRYPARPSPGREPHHEPHRAPRCGPSRPNRASGPDDPGRSGGPPPPHPPRALRSPHSSRRLPARRISEVVERPARYGTMTTSPSQSALASGISCPV